MKRKEAFEDLIKRKGEIAKEKLDEFFATLEPVKTEEMTGKWRGGYFPTGNKWEWLVKDYVLFKWYGKEFFVNNRVKVFIVSFLGMKFNLPLCTAVLRASSFKGKISGSIDYDHFPIVDYFRKIDEDTIMGIMEVKGKTQTYFYLKRL